jgi:lysylphosphatidylglycerol synthetase-like protein (DUF2156 family)
MIKLTNVFGTVLFLLGIGSYLASDAASITALIPAIFGVLLIALARLAWRGIAWAIPAAAVVAAVGLLGVLPNLPAVFTLLTGGDAARPVATAAQGLMALLCSAFLACFAATWRRRGTTVKLTAGA